MLSIGRKVFEGAIGVKKRDGTMRSSEFVERVSVGMGPGEVQPPGREGGRAKTGVR